MGKRYAVIAAVTISITLGVLLLSSQEVRASIIDVIIEMYEQFMEFKNEKRGSDSKVEFKVEPDYIPEGYSLAEELDTPLFIRKIYRNTEGRKIEIGAYLSKKYTYQIDNEAYDISSCDINGYSGRIFMSKKDEDNIITWSFEDVGMYIEADLSKKELKKIAKKT